MGCNSAAKYTEKSLKDKFFPGPDLLNRLLGIKSKPNGDDSGHRVHVSPGAVLKDKFLCKFLRFLW